MSSVRLNGSSTIARGLFALAVSIAGCSSNGSTGTITGGLGDITGSYTLRRVDGVLLPDSVPNATDTIVVQMATMTLNDDGTYSLMATGTDNGQQGTVLADDGVFAVASSTITFNSGTFGVVYTAHATPGTFTASIPGTFLHSTSDAFQWSFARSGTLP